MKYYFKKDGKLIPTENEDDSDYILLSRKELYDLTQPLLDKIEHLRDTTTSAAIKDLQEDLRQADAEVDAQIELNRNLRRICRERANKDRNIDHRKEHSGFLPLGTQEQRERYTDTDRTQHSIQCWRTTISTPYDNSVDPYLFNAWDDGLNAFFDGRINERYDADFDESSPAFDESGKNILFHLRFSQGQDGYWLAYCTHTRLISADKIVQ